jgi:inosose dehydratase
MMTAERVLREMASVGLRATELGSPGFLPADAGALRAALAEHDLRLVGGFVPLVVHDDAAAVGAIREANRVAALFEAAGAEVFVLAAVVDYDWAPRRPLAAHEWKHLAKMLDLLDRVAEDHGLQHVLHPHVGTLVQTRHDIERVLNASDVRWCLDTGHLTIGGFDPLSFAIDYGERVGHVHLKDVDLASAERLQKGELSLMAATEKGLFKPLGRGDVPIDQIVTHLERSGYDGWYVLEQDTSITGELPAEGRGPVEDVRISIDYLRAVLEGSRAA